MNAPGKIAGYKGIAKTDSLAKHGTSKGKGGDTSLAPRGERPHKGATLAFSRELQTIRVTLGISQEILAQVLRVTVRTVSRWENGETQPTSPGDLAQIKRLKALMDLGLKAYSRNGLQSLLAESQPVFGNKTGIDMLAFGEYERVAAAIEADFEGLGY
jgi:transcriptional regulator with XRE-family HTH domain